MNHPCESIDPLLPLAALGALEPAEQAAVDAHLAAGCPRCAARLESFREASEGLTVLNVPMNPPPAVREQLLARVRAAKAELASASAPTRWLAVAPYVAAAVVFAALGAWVASRPRPAAPVDRMPSVAEWTHEVGGATLSRCAQGVLRTDESGGASVGHYLWDPVAGQLHLIAFGLTEDPAKPTLRAWLRDGSGRWRALGELKSGTPGVHTAALSVDSPHDASITLSVTREPAGPAGDAPTGPVVLEGDLSAALP